MKLSNSWLNKRKVFLLYFSLEIVIYISIHTSTSINHKINNIFYLISWIILSYILGRYHNNYLNIKKNLFAKFVQTLSTIFCTNLLYYLFIAIESIFYKQVFFSPDFFIISITFGFISYLAFSIIQNIFLKKLKMNREWLFVGSKEKFINLKNLSKFPNKNIYLKRKTKNLHLKNITLKKYSGVVLSDRKYIRKKEIDLLIDLQTHGLFLIDEVTWMEFEFQKLPTEIIKFDDLLKRSFNLDRKSISFRIKRTIDISMSLILIILTLPLIIFFGFLIYIEDKGPIFYSQLRRGFKGYEFKIWKLRSMYLNAEPKGAIWAKTNDERITKIGKFIRSTGIDEIPQLINILKGEMSFIGPRPERPEIDEELILKIPFYKLRYLHKPGLSGWAQVNFRYASSIKDTKKKLSYDLYYIKNFSIPLDILIFLKTIRLIFNRRKSSQII